MSNVTIRNDITQHDDFVKAKACTGTTVRHYRVVRTYYSSQYAFIRLRTVLRASSASRCSALIQAYTIVLQYSSSKVKARLYQHVTVLWPRCLCAPVHEIVTGLEESFRRAACRTTAAITCQLRVMRHVVRPCTQHGVLMQLHSCDSMSARRASKL